MFVGFEPLFPDYGFVRPDVMVEFGARATGEPREERLIGCNAAPYISEVAFPSVRTLVIQAERTFWEKATAVQKRSLAATCTIWNLHCVPGMALNCRNSHSSTPALSRTRSIAAMLPVE